jgi:hypothetical protein
MTAHSKKKSKQDSSLQNQKPSYPIEKWQSTFSELRSAFNSWDQTIEDHNPSKKKKFPSNSLTKGSNNSSLIGFSSPPLNEENLSMAPDEKKLKEIRHLLQEIKGQIAEF